MFGKKEKTEESAPILEREGQFVAQLNKQAYDWLGSSYTYFDKIRNAGQGGLAGLFEDRNLEELMEATRSALSIITKTLKNGLALAYNSVVDAVANAGDAPEGWPDKIDSSDRANPPHLNPEQDALIMAFMPLKFLNLAKSVRDKGKGLDLYTEGLVKKLYFKVIGYYSDPAHWDPERLGFNLAGLPEDAALMDVNNKLSVMKSDLELFATAYQIFKFGRSPRTGADASTKNALENAMEVTDEDIVRDLYFQHFIVMGMEQFMFRYFLTLLAATSNPRALRAITAVFEPALAKVTEVRVQFQGSFMTEREKVRVRQPFQAFVKEFESRPVVEQIEEKGRTVRHINYSLRLLDATTFGHAAKLSERHAKNWAGYFEAHVLDSAQNEVSKPLVLEVLNTLVQSSKLENDGRLKVAESLRAFGDDQERLGMRQVSLKKKKYDDAKRKKMAQSRKFKVLEQFDVAKTVQEEAEALEQDGQKQIEAMEQALAKRKEAYVQRAQLLEEQAQSGGTESSAQSAGAVFQVLAGLDGDNSFQNDFVGYLLTQIREGSDTGSNDLYRQLFAVLPNLYPTQKIMLRKALESKIELADDEMLVSDDEMRAYQEQIVTRKTELTAEAPGVFQQKLNQGQVRADVENLLGAAIMNPSLQLLLQIPLNAPNKPAAKLPGPVVQKLMQLNALINPFPEVDLILPNVDGTAPPAKRLNFNRLSKALDDAARAAAQAEAG